MDLDDCGLLLFFCVMWSYMTCKTPKQRAIVLIIDMALVAYFDYALGGAPSRGYF